MNKTILSSLLLASFAVSCGKKTEEVNKGNEEAYGSSTSVAKASTVNSLSKDSFVPDRVFFDYDSAKLTEEAKASLLLQVKFLKSEKGISNLVIEGHSDERGTQEYNKILGLKRSNAVVSFLKSNGVKVSIKAVSFGKDRPEVAGSDEESYAQNRRSVTVVSYK